VRPRRLSRAAPIAPIVALVVLLGASTGHAATRCATQRVDGGQVGGRLTVRTTLLGSVTCAGAHRIVATYFHKMKTGQCGRLNNFCNLTLAGDWNCSIFSAGVSATAGGAAAGCANQHTSARIRIFVVARRRPAPAAVPRSP
jgi:hypothetical protein